MEKDIQIYAKAWHDRQLLKGTMADNLKRQNREQSIALRYGLLEEKDKERFLALTFARVKELARPRKSQILDCDYKSGVRRRAKEIFGLLSEEEKYSLADGRCCETVNTLVDASVPLYEGMPVGTDSRFHEAVSEELRKIFINEQIMLLEKVKKGSSASVVSYGDGVGIQVHKKGDSNPQSSHIEVCGKYTEVVIDAFEKLQHKSFKIQSDFVKNRQKVCEIESNRMTDILAKKVYQLLLRRLAEQYGKQKKIRAANIFKEYAERCGKDIEKELKDSFSGKSVAESITLESYIKNINDGMLKKVESEITTDQEREEIRQDLWRITEWLLDFKWFKSIHEWWKKPAERAAKTRAEVAKKLSSIFSEGTTQTSSSRRSDILRYVPCPTA